MEVIVDKEMERAFAQIAELQKQLLRGNLQPLEVRRPLQAILEHRFEAEASGLPDWYVSPLEQINDVYRWNIERNWGFADNDFPKHIPAFTPSSPLEVLVLAVYLPDKDGVPGYVRTANELWEIARGLQPNWWQWDELKLDTDHLRLLDGITHQPGIRWVALDLGAHWNARDGVRPRDVRGEDSAHAEVLAAAAHFPQWASAMDGGKVPYAWLSGYQVTIPGDEAWTGVPLLNWNRHNRKVNLNAYWDGNRNWYYALPVRRDCSKKNNPLRKSGLFD